MPGFSNLFEAEVMKMLLGKPLGITLPLTPHLALLTQLPGEDGTGGVEVSGGGYARQPMSAKFGTPTNGDNANSTVFDFGTASAGLGNIVGFEIRSSLTAGQMFMQGVFTPAITVVQGQPVQIPVGALQLQLD